MNYEDIFNLVYSNSTSISESILEIVGDNYLIEEERYKYEPLLNFIDYLTSTSISESYIDEVLSTFFGSLSEEVINEVSDEYIRMKAKGALKSREKAYKGALQAEKSASGANKAVALKNKLDTKGALDKVKRVLKNDDSYSERKNKFVTYKKPTEGGEITGIKQYGEGSHKFGALDKLKSTARKVWRKAKEVARKTISKKTPDTKAVTKLTPANPKEIKVDKGLVQSTPTEVQSNAGTITRAQTGSGEIKTKNTNISFEHPKKKVSKKKVPVKVDIIKDVKKGKSTKKEKVPVKVRSNKKNSTESQMKLDLK